jgi:hypothetical protein
MKWSDKYRYLGRPGQVIYVLPSRYRALGGRSLIFALGTYWVTMIASIWTSPLVGWFGLGAAMSISMALMFFARLKGRRVVLRKGFQQAPPKHDLRWVFANVAVWSAGILLFWLLLQMRP